MPLLKPTARPAHFRKLVADRETYATTLLVILADLFGYEFFEWTPETIRLELRDELQVDVPETNMNKIAAGIALITSDDFYHDLPKFITLCNTLADGDFQPDVFDPADTSEIAWALTEAALLNEPDEPHEQFSDDIRRYIGAVANQEGLVNPPDVLALAARDEIRDPLYADTSDPEMYSAIWKAQEEKGDSIKQMLQTNIQELFQQLHDLPLLNGNTKELLQKLRRELAAKH